MNNSNFSVKITDKVLLKMIKELKPLLWFGVFIVFFYVSILGIRAIAPDGFYHPSNVPTLKHGNKTKTN